MMRKARWRAPTLKGVGRAAWIVGAIALTVPVIWRAFWPTPIATIDAPLAGSAVTGCYIAKGRLVPSTIRHPLWLIGAEAGHDWHPVARIDRAKMTWHQETCAEGFSGTRDRLALVVVDDALDAAFEQRQREGNDDLPEWMTPNYGTVQQGGRGRRHRYIGFSPIPEKAKRLASVELVADGNPPFPLSSMRPVFDEPVRPAFFTGTEPETP